MQPEVVESTSEKSALRAFLYSVPYALLFYVLSIGPMYWVIFRAYRLEGSAFIYWFYYPLVKLSDIPYVANFFDWYISLWI